MHGLSPYKERESPQELPRSQASQVSATRSLNTVYTIKQVLSTRLFVIRIQQYIMPEEHLFIQEIIVE